MAKPRIKQLAGLGSQAYLLNTPLLSTVNYAGPDEETLYTFDVPADTVNEDGEYILVEAWGLHDGSGVSNTTRLRVEGADVVNVATGSAATFWHLIAKIYRTGASAQRVVGEFQNPNYDGGGVADISESWASAMTLDITAENSTDTAGEIHLYAVHVYHVRP